MKSYLPGDADGIGWAPGRGIPKSHCDGAPPKTNQNETPGQLRFLCMFFTSALSRMFNVTKPFKMSSMVRTQGPAATN